MYFQLFLFAIVSFILMVYYFLINLVTIGFINCSGSFNLNVMNNKDIFDIIKCKKLI